MKKNSKRSISLLASVLVIALSVITVAAYLFINLGPVTNIFKPAVAEDPTVKNDYTVQVPNKGYAVYVRAAIVVNWQYKDGEGNVKVLGDVPVEGVDYTLTLNADDWLKGSDGFYYYKTMVTPAEKDTTASIVSEFTTLKTVVYDGVEYSVNIDIISQTIQALGTTDDGTKRAVEDAWGERFTFDGDNNITAVS